MVAPARGLGDWLRAWSVCSYHEAPFQAHVSPSGWPLAPSPPNKISWWSFGSNAIEADRRAGGAWTCDPEKSVQLDPSQTQVSLERVPFERLPPKRTTV